MKTIKSNILLLGSYGRGNIGDDVFLLSAIKLFKDHGLYINSANDDLLPKQLSGKVETIATENVELFRKIKIFLKVNHIVYYGGDLWVELHGDRYPRKALYKMIFVNVLGRLFRKQVHYIGCGAGELEGYSLTLARLSAKIANSLMVREKETATLLAIKKTLILPDLAFTIDTPTQNNNMPRVSKQKIHIGISLLYHLPDPKTNFPLALNYLAELMSSLPKNRFTITFLPMMRSGSITKDDYWVYQQLQDKLPTHKIKVLRSDNVEDYIKTISQMDIVVGARLHANILAILAGTPCLGVAYRKKVERLFEQNTLGKYYVNLEEMHMLKQKFNHMVLRQEQIKRKFLEVREKNIEEASNYQELIAKIF